MIYPNDIRIAYDPDRYTYAFCLEIGKFLTQNGPKEYKESISDIGLEKWAKKFSETYDLHTVVAYKGILSKSPEIVGVVIFQECVSFTCDKFTWVYIIATHSQFRKCHIGADMLRLVIEKTTPNISLICEKNNTEAVKFYGAIGSSFDDSYYEVSIDSVGSGWHPI
jgi:ribosomal protein S18 acetylase RimI-like enzyme